MTQSQLVTRPASIFSTHIDPHAAAIIADLLTHVWLAADGAPIIQEALDYLTTARCEHPSQPIAWTVTEWLDATLTDLTLSKATLQQTDQQYR